CACSPVFSTLRPLVVQGYGPGRNGHTIENSSARSDQPHVFRGHSRTLAQPMVSALAGGPKCASLVACRAWPTTASGARTWNQERIGRAAEAVRSDFLAVRTSARPSTSLAPG